jgi:methionyl aminopeptidase
LHEEPEVYNIGRPGEGEVLRPGLVIAIEPMIVLGKSQVREDKNGVFITADNSLAAHFEHTVAITAAGPKILTI